MKTMQGIFLFLIFSLFFLPSCNESSNVPDKKTQAPNLNASQSVANKAVTKTAKPKKKKSIKKLGNNDFVICLFETGKKDAKDAEAFVSAIKQVRNVSDSHIAYSRDVFQNTMKNVKLDPKSTCIIYYRGKGGWFFDVNIEVSCNHVLFIADMFNTVCDLKSPVSSMKGETCSVFYQNAGNNWNHVKYLSDSIHSASTDTNSDSLLTVSEVYQYANRHPDAKTNLSFAQLLISGGFSFPELVAFE